jgi:hypothetical protein
MVFVAVPPTGVLRKNENTVALSDPVFTSILPPSPRSFAVFGT